MVAYFYTVMFMSDSDRPNQKKHFHGYSPLAKGYMLGTLVLTAAIQMVLPIIAGSWLDKRLNTEPVFVLIGIALGILIMVTQLLRIVKKV